MTPAWPPSGDGAANPPDDDPALQAHLLRIKGYMRGCGLLAFPSTETPLRDQLAQRSWRALFADQMREALAVIEAEGIAPVSTTPLPASLTPFILKLPDALFTRIAASMVKIDPKARSSMWEDLQRGRRTEIDHLQGLIVALAQRHGLPAPLSTRIVALIREAERAAKGSPGLSAEQVRAG